MGPTITDLKARISDFQLLTNADGPGQHTGSWDASGRQETLTMKCGWDNHETFLAIVAGVPQSYGTGSGTKIVRQVPLVYPYNPKLYATSLQWRGVNAHSDPTKRTMGDARPFASRVYTVGFGTLPFLPDVSDQPFMSKQIRGSFDVRTVPGLGLAFSSGEKIDQDFGRIVSLKTIEIVRYQIPDLDAWESYADTFLGKVNSVALRLRNTSYAAGYVLFPTYDSSEKKTVSGQVDQQITLSFLYSAVPWNSAIRSDGVVDTYTPAVYPTADLSGLISFGA